MCRATLRITFESSTTRQVFMDTPFHEGSVRSDACVTGKGKRAVKPPPPVAEQSPQDRRSAAPRRPVRSIRRPPAPSRDRGRGRERATDDRTARHRRASRPAPHNHGHRPA
ncbi:hypothetical protein WR25_13819 [Diploscapter pachys]|uniref:Uncharacterized protein n=1 Tax=Diploscapter pachys TaxID=2018661 RepID=A0A2A2JZI0_9BILA|nr:hypothetical protein WR25_13819 [Diploscapter pachys]